MNWALGSALAVALVLGACVQPDARLHSRRNCKGEDCSEKTKSPIKNSSPAPADFPAEDPKVDTSASEPTEVSDKIASDRRFFQSRSVIALRPSEDLLGSEDEFSVVNATSKKTLIPRQTLGTGLLLNDGTQPFKLSANEHDFLLRLYPILGLDEGQFQYGANSLRLWINSDNEQKVSLIEIWLNDFDLMAATTATLRPEGESSGGFEGWINTMANPVVSREDSSMTVGFYSIVND